MPQLTHEEQFGDLPSQLTLRSLQRTQACKINNQPNMPMTEGMETSIYMSIGERDSYQKDLSTLSFIRYGVNLLMLIAAFRWA